MTDPRRPVPAAVLRAALRLMPPGRKAWAEGMAVELSYSEDRGSGLMFALGCLWAALSQRLIWTCSLAGADTFLLGAGFGALFLAHAGVDGSRAWPLIWPLIGGASAALRQGRRLADPAGQHWTRCWRVLGRGATAGLMSAAVFGIGSAALLWAPGGSALQARMGVLIAGAAAGVAASSVAALAASIASGRVFGR